MTLQFIQENTSGFASAKRVIDLDQSPAPTVMAVGIGGDNTSHYYIADDGKRSHRPDDKPPYRVPSMAEIAAIEPNGHSIVSTFSGCGGSCLGFKMAGYRVLWANEFVPAAQDVYRRNHPDTILDTRDIRTVTADDILAATRLHPGELDVLEGSPPCASFSTAGKREAGWGKVKAYSDTAQKSDDLFFEYVRLLDGLQPKTFVAENVSGLVKGTAKGYFKLILAAMKACGYRVEAKLLDAQWLGVPQARQRIIFMGVRNDLDAVPAYPKPLPYRYSVRDALPWITSVDIGKGFGEVETKDANTVPYQPFGTGPQQGNGLAQQVESLIEGANGFDGHAYYDTDAPMPTVQASRPVRVVTRIVNDSKGLEGVHIDDVNAEPMPTIRAGGGGHQTGWRIEQTEETDISRYAIGAEWDKLQPGDQSSKYFSLVRTDPTQPCPTVTGQGGNISTAAITHPTERRKFTIAELKRICAFPDDFILTGSYAQQWERLGRAVPPVMMSHVARILATEVLDRCKP